MPFFHSAFKKLRPINLLIELNAFDVGGLQKVVLDMALRLDREKINPVIVSIGKTGRLAEQAVQQGIKVYGLSGNRRKMYASILRENRINLSNSHFSTFGYPILRWHGIPNVTFIHNVYAFLRWPLTLRMRLHDVFVTKYISVSQKATEYATQVLHLPQRKIVTIPNGLILSEHQRRSQNHTPLARADFGLRPTDYVFLNVASYNLHKGHYLMADAMKTILKSRDDVKILCIGNEIVPAHVAELRKYLADNGLGNHMLLPGYFPNVESFFEIADAFLLPSFIEGWSIAMNEAMYYGKPMILTDTGGSAEALAGDVNGLLIENEYGSICNLHSKLLDKIAFTQRSFRTAPKLVEAMLQFADNREKWRIAGQKGREKVERLYDFDSVVKQYEREFEAVLGTT